MKRIKKVQCVFVILALMLALIPFQIFAGDDTDTYDIVGWYDENCLDAVTSVKVNGRELSEYNTSMYDAVPEADIVTAQASSELNVEIALEEGYALSAAEDGGVLYLSGVQSESSGLTKSSSETTIRLPSAEWCKNDRELYLAFRTEREPEPGESGIAVVDKVVVNVDRIDCGTQIKDDTDVSESISVPSGSGYRIVPGSLCLVREEGINYVENVDPFVAEGKKTATVSFDIEDRGSFIFSKEMNEDCITVNNGKLLGFDMVTCGGPDDRSKKNEICLTVSIDLKHAADDLVIEDRVEPTCTEPGHYTESGICSRCGEPVKSRVEIPSPGHTFGTKGDSRFTCTVCGFVDKARKKACNEKDLAGFIAGVSCSSTSKKVTVKWGKVPGAGRYIVYAAYCNKNENKKFKKIKTVGSKVTKCGITRIDGAKLNPKKHVKAYIVAQRKKNGKWSTILKTPSFHIAGAKTKYSNVKVIKVSKAKFDIDKGGTAVIKPKLVLINKKKKAIDHVSKYRYQSTCTAVAKVSKKGKITASG